MCPKFVRVKSLKYLLEHSAFVSHSCVISKCLSHLDADLIGLWWSNLNLFNHQRLVGLPSHSSLTFNDLVDNDST